MLQRAMECGRECLDVVEGVEGSMERLVIASWTSGGSIQRLVGGRVEARQPPSMRLRYSHPLFLVSSLEPYRGHLGSGVRFCSDCFLLLLTGNRVFNSGGGGGGVDRAPKTSVRE